MGEELDRAKFNGHVRDDDPTFYEYLEAARDGSDEAASQLAETFRTYLMRVAENELDPALQAKVGASDIVQETLIRAQNEFHQNRSTSRAEFTVWLLTILRNHVTDLRRAYHRDKRNVRREQTNDNGSGHGNFLTRLTSGRLTPSSGAIAAEEYAMLRSAMDRLPVDYRAVISLRSWRQLPLPEVAEKMNRTVDATRKLWARAIRRLREEFESE